VRLRSLSARVLIAVLLTVLGAGVALAVVHRTGSSRTVNAIDMRVWFVQLKLRGAVPHLGWAEVVRRMGPEWSHRYRYDVARMVGRGEAPCPVLWDTPLGRFWGTEKDGRELDLLSLEQAGGDIYEQRDVVVREGDVVVDVGAHLGSFTRVALNRGARVVVAVEPDPVNTACLVRTFAPEIAAGRVRLVKAAAWHSSGSLTFELGPSTQMGHVADASHPAASHQTTGARRITVPAVTLDAAIEGLGIDRVDFVKMDIEGAERHALAGARHLLATHKPRMAICIYHAPDDPEVVPRVILAANGSYQTFTRGGFQAYFH
jgi:FkbM family methyltransferase